MNAFGKRNGLGNTGSARPNFGVARPMKAGPGGAPAGGEQFPPVEELAEIVDDAPLHASNSMIGAMDRLNKRQNASGEAGASKTEGFGIDPFEQARKHLLLDPVNRSAS
jgi:pilus assembly protein CpaF